MGMFRSPTFSSIWIWIPLSLVLLCSSHSTQLGSSDFYLWMNKFGLQMDGDFYSGIIGSGIQVDDKVLHTFQNNFVQVQKILDQNRLLINEINQNHESKVPDNLTRNVGLIRELNNNIRRVVELYGDLSTSFIKSGEASSQGDSGGTLKSDGKAGSKRIRSG